MLENCAKLRQSWRLLKIQVRQSRSGGVQQKKETHKKKRAKTKTRQDNQRYDGVHRRLAKLLQP